MYARLQLLPCVCEVIRWYDAHILEAFWNTYLLPKTSLITYGAALTLKYSLHHAAKLQAMIDDPPTTWQVCSSVFYLFICYSCIVCLFLQGGSNVRL